MARGRLSHDTRKRLLDEGVSLLIDQGYHGTGIKEVLDRVDVPKGSFYNYFESKEHFGAEVLRHFAQGTHERMDAWLGKPKADALSALKAFFGEEIRRHEAARLGCLLGNLGAELGERSELCREAMAEGLKGMEERFSRALACAQEEGTVRNDIPARELATFLLNAYEGALLRMKIEGSVDPLRKLCSLVLDEFLRR
ncbi:MAG: TetR family transcriptional regulator C-terminal domain-containing protein [Acidobacteriota bacterium]